jgi:P pilus assembly chaperone PapD
MKRTLLWSAALIASLGYASLAHAEMVLSQVIVDLLPGKPTREDIEVWNDGDDRMYVVAEPSEILDAGTAHLQRLAVPSSEDAGLLVVPRRLVLEPGERRTIRIATFGDRPAAERVYRVAIKPVAGPLSAEQSALKVLVGYDTLVLVRPAALVDNLRAERTGDTLTLRNLGNVSQEIFAGSQCSGDGRDCRTLPDKRLYPGGVWTQSLPFETPIRYKSSIGSKVRERTF